MDFGKIFILYVLDDDIFLRVENEEYVTDSTPICEGPSFDNCARSLIRYSGLSVIKILRVSKTGKSFGYIALLDESERGRDSCFPCWRNEITYEKIHIDELSQYKILRDKEQIVPILESYKNGKYAEIPLERSREPWEF